MANIVLTTYCNLHCPYCFADKMIKQEDIKNIDLVQFKKILNWSDGEGRIGLIGGEPTLHPQFKEILEIISNYNQDTEFILFTNGIYLEQYIPFLPKNLSILININQPQAMTTQQYLAMVKCLIKLDSLGWINSEYHKVTLGCNICQEIDDYKFFWDIVKRFRPPAVRFSIVAPTKKEQLNNKEEYYLTMKNKFLDFVVNANSNNVLLSPDCNQIPMCYFSQEEIEYIDKQFVPEERFGYLVCNPVIDIEPDFTATSCFGCYKKIDCSPFLNIHELYRYIVYKVMGPAVLKNCSGRCKDCNKFDNLQCQGGCLAFSRRE